MTKEDEKQKILTLISKGYLIPMSIYDPKNINEILEDTFMVDGKETPILKEYSIDLQDVLTATIDPRYNLEES